MGLDLSCDRARTWRPIAYGFDIILFDNRDIRIKTQGVPP